MLAGTSRRSPARLLGLSVLFYIAPLALADITRADNDSPTVHITGKVVLPSGAPVPNATVTLDVFDFDMPGTLTTVQTDAGGQYSIDAEPANTEQQRLILYAASPAGVAIDTAGTDGSNPNKATTFTWSTTLTARDLVLQPPAVLRVHVADDDGKPAAHVRLSPLIFLHNGDVLVWNDAAHPAWTQTTDETGTALISGLPSGKTVFLRSEDNRYTRNSEEWGISLVNTPSGTDKTIHFHPAASISGTVTDSTTGLPAAGVVVYNPAYHDVTFKGVLTDKLGHYHMGSLSAGKYTIGIDDSHGQNDLTAPSRSVEVASAQSVTGIDFSLVHGALLTGKVVDDVRGMPVARASIDLDGPTNSNPHTLLTTAADGTYRVRVAPGTQTITVSRSDTGAHPGPVTVQVADGDAKSIDFKFPGSDLPWPVHGRVIGLDGKPVADAEVIARQLFQKETVVKSESDGTFVFDQSGLKLGANIYALKGSLATADKTEPDFDKDVTLVIKPGALCALTGRVVNQDGAPIPNAKVALTFWIAINPASEVDTTTTDAHGVYEFRSMMPNAPYSVSVDAAGYSSHGSNYVWADAGSRVTFPVITLEATDSYVGGTVLDASGNPVNGAQVSADSQSATTGRDGRFALKNVSRGHVTVWVYAPDSRNGYAEVPSAQTHSFIRVYTQAENDANMQHLESRWASLHPVPTIHGNGEDANVLLAQAERRATAEHKKIFVGFYGQGCAPCVRMHRFLEDPVAARVIGSHFVVQQFDIGGKAGWQNPGASELYDQYTDHEGQGVPFYALLDENGHDLAEGMSNHVNTGMPGHPEDVPFFLGTLKKADATLSPVEIKTLGKAIKGYLIHHH